MNAPFSSAVQDRATSDRICSPRAIFHPKSTKPSATPTLASSTDLRSPVAPAVMSPLPAGASGRLAAAPWNDKTHGLELVVVHRLPPLGGSQNLLAEALSWYASAANVGLSSRSRGSEMPCWEMIAIVRRCSTVVERSRYLRRVTGSCGPPLTRGTVRRSPGDRCSPSGVQSCTPTSPTPVDDRLLRVPSAGSTCPTPTETAPRWFMLADERCRRSHARCAP